MSETELAQRVRSAAIFARTMPEQKLRIVNAVKASGEVVAMTGDGVNDAPALKAAHIGIAMGGRGTDVAREAAALVLLDDDFTSIVAAIRLGRRIYDNLQKAMAYILAVHVPIAGLALLPLLFGLPLVFSPLHIAFLEMVIDPVCSIVFEAEGQEEDTMRRPPRDSAAPLVTAGFAVWSLLQGALVLVLVAGLFVAALRPRATRTGGPLSRLRHPCCGESRPCLDQPQPWYLGPRGIQPFEPSPMVGCRCDRGNPCGCGANSAGQGSLPFRTATRPRYRRGAGLRHRRPVAAGGRQEGVPSSPKGMAVTAERATAGNQLPHFDSKYSIIRTT